MSTKVISCSGTSGTNDVAGLPPPVELQHLLGAIQGDQEAMDQFVSVNAGTLSPEVFFATENIAALLGSTAMRGAGVPV